MTPRHPHRPVARATAPLALALAAACAATSGDTTDHRAMAPTDDAARDSRAEAPALEGYLAARASEVAGIPPARREVLEGLVEAVESALAEDGAAELVFICTHNSRRSQMAQVWARIAAERAGVDGVETFSGGTESTAFHPSAVAALERAGLTLDRGDEAPGEEFSTTPNHVYEVSGGPLTEPLACWSKTFGDGSNPRSDFIAVMTCSEADEACPLVPGAAARVPVTYVDPKVSDGTDDEAATYDERCAQIACEMIHVFDAVAARGD